MTRFNSYEMSYLDMDIYAFLNGVPIHIATMGNGIPDALNDRNVIYRGMRLVSKLKADGAFILNNAALRKCTESGYEYLNELNTQDISHVIERLPNFEDLKEYEIPQILYAWSFVDKAKKGFYSFNTIRDENTGRLSHKLIAMPAVEFELQNHILPRLSWNVSMDDVLDGRVDLSFEMD